MQVLKEDTQIFDNLMVDIETLGNESYSAILAIAAVEFNMKNEIGRVFYKNISLESCLSAGMKVTASTVEWWVMQGDIAKKNMFSGERLTINKALYDFKAWFGEMKYNVWGNSALFDLGILRNAFSLTGMEVPWSYKDERCLRTLCALLPEIKQNHIFMGIGHHPVDDCLNQIEYGCKTWQMLKGLNN